MNENKKDKLISIDPSGTGTTGICFIGKKNQEEFFEITSKNWKEHLDFVIELIKQKKPNLIIFEDTNYIHRKTKDGLSLFRLLGAIEGLSSKWKNNASLKTKNINVLKVKEITKKLLKKEVKIPNLEYLPGRGKGWMFKGKRISVHCLEAFIVYYLSER